MNFSLELTLALALIIGLTLGLLGGGGAILAVPVLTYITGLEPVQAIPTSLFIVGVTSLVSLSLHAAKKRVVWRTGLIFGVAAMVGAFAGGRAGAYVPAPVLMLSFAAVMTAAAIAMIRGRRQTGDQHERPPELPISKVLATGAVVGLVSGFVGAGGGFLIVPALVLLARLPMPRAVATSLLIITMQSASGLRPLDPTRLVAGCGHRRPRRCRILHRLLAQQPVAQSRPAQGIRVFRPGHCCSRRHRGDSPAHRVRAGET
ncbi:MAG: sulfite exporter TauE/SafE family protein [Brevibacterium aurantiacum]